MQTKSTAYSLRNKRLRIPPVFPCLYSLRFTCLTELRKYSKRSHLSQGVIFWSKIRYRGSKRQSEYSRRQYVALPVVRGAPPATRPRVGNSQEESPDIPVWNIVRDTQRSSEDESFGNTLARDPINISQVCRECSRHGTSTKHLFGGT